MPPAFPLSRSSAPPPPPAVLQPCQTWSLQPLLPFHSPSPNLRFAVLLLIPSPPPCPGVSSHSVPGGTAHGRVKACGLTELWFMTAGLEEVPDLALRLCTSGCLRPPASLWPSTLTPPLFLILGCRPHFLLHRENRPLADGLLLLHSRVPLLVTVVSQQCSFPSPSSVWAWRPEHHCRAVLPIFSGSFPAACECAVVSPILTPAPVAPSSLYSKPLSYPNPPFPAFFSFSLELSPVGLPFPSVD